MTLMRPDWSYWYDKKTYLGLAVVLGLLVLFAPPLAAQDDQDADQPAEEAMDEEQETPEDLQFFGSTSVTATLNESKTQDLPTPVTVVEAKRIEELQPDNAADLLRDEPGVDVNGIGPNQARPVIRGQRGHRVLFLQDSIRMNNTRRQTDFGEITGLVDVSNVETLEVVRGAGSVLYGSDAIGGVLNLITKVPKAGSGITGTFGVRASDSDDQTKIDGGVRSAGDKFSWGLSASTRDAGNYHAPSGSFGDIQLDQSVEVFDSGVQDDSYNLFLGYNLDESKSMFFRADVYRADDAGFGYVDPDLFNDPVLNRIYYPFQDFDRYTAGYSSTGTTSSVRARVYSQNNERDNGFFLDINIGPAFGPGSGPDGSVVIDSIIFSDVETQGVRVDATKSFGTKNLVTYGLDYYEDDVLNARESTTTTTLAAYFPVSFICGPAGAIPVPPDFHFECVFEEISDRPSAPNATSTNSGLFVQNEYFGENFTAIAGLRLARSEMTANPTPQWDLTGLDFSDDDVVYSLGIVYKATPTLNIVGSYATAFRSPNLIERLFDGLTPEGLGYQILNPDLVSETSNNFDIGLKYNSGNAFYELIYFETEIEDAIVQHTLSPDEIAALPPDVQVAIDQSSVDFVVQQRNADILTIDGVEAAAGYHFDNGVSIGANFTHLQGESRTGGPAADPTGDTFSEKINGHVRYDSDGGRWWAEYRVRHNAEEDQELDPNAVVPPVGEVLPSFTIHNLAGGVHLGSSDKVDHSIGLLVNNATDELYAEFSNAGFFRPQPERTYVLTYRLRTR